MTTKKDPPNNEGSGPAHMSGNSYSSIIPQAPPIQVGEGGASERPQPREEVGGKQVDKLSPKALDAAIREAIILALSQPMSKRVSAVESLLRAEYKQLLNELPEKRSILDNPNRWPHIAYQNTAHMSFNDALDQCRAIILKKLEELQ